METHQEKIIGRVITGVVVIGIILVIILTGKSPEEKTATPITQDNVNQSETMETSQERTQLTLKTNEGDITLELFNDLAPNTVQNFTNLAESGFYDNVRFHRIIEGFMIQSGDPKSKEESLRMEWGTGGPGYMFADEIHAENKNAVGTISMANAGPNTNGSQFFINVADNNFLDQKHTVFGKVVEGMDIVEKISFSPTFPNDQPVDDIVIESIAIK
jgi:cyclophilin family peptidyl-prolyl cis-trans isomerase